MVQIHKKMLQENNTGFIVAGIGLLATGIGRLLGGKLGDTLSGFGIAHLVLGILDCIRSR